MVPNWSVLLAASWGLLAALTLSTRGEAVTTWTPEMGSPPAISSGAQLDSLLAAAEAALESGDAWSASWNAAYIENSMSAGSAGEDGAGNGGTAEVRKRLEKLHEKAGPLLHPSQVASIIAWWGNSPSRSLMYAHAMARENRRDDAAAEGMAFLASYPSHEGAEDAAEWVQRANEPMQFAGGGHQTVFRVAAILPLTGPYDLTGKSILAGVTLAIEEHNLTAAVPIRIVSYDGAGEAWTTARRAEEAIADGAGVLVGAVLDAPTLTLAGIAQAKGVPLFSPAATEHRLADHR